MSRILVYAAKLKNKNHAYFCIFIKLLAASAMKTYRSGNWICGTAYINHNDIELSDR